MGYDKASELREWIRWGNDEEKVVKIFMAFLITRLRICITLIWSNLILIVDLEKNK